MKRDDRRERRGSGGGSGCGGGGGRSATQCIKGEKRKSTRGPTSQTSGAGRSGAGEKVEEEEEETDKLVNDGENSAQGQREKERKHARTAMLPASTCVTNLQCR